MASADLGGLGAKEGPPVTYNWARASLLLVALPWLATLLLLLLKPNRRPQAWWIAAPLLCLVVGASSLLPALWNLVWPSLFLGALQAYQDILGELAFALAAVWLVSAYLKSRSRIANVLGFLGVLLGFSALYFLTGLDWTGPESMVEVGVAVALSALLIPVGIGLAGWFCRRRYRPLALSLWLALVLPVLFFLALAPLFVALTYGGGVPLIALLRPVFILASMCFGVLLPFLLLSFSSPFYRARLVDLLCLAPEPLAASVAAPPARIPSEETAERLKATTAAAHHHGAANPPNTGVGE